MEPLAIKKITLDDLDQLQKIGIKTFTQTYAADNTEANFKQYLENSFSLVKLKTEITHKDTAFYFVTLRENPIGYLKVNFGAAQTENKKENSLEIERIYVLKKFQGKRVGQLLFEKALEIAQQMNVDYVWLGVWEKNPKAIRFYQKNGFVEFDQHIFILGEEEQTDLMMKLKVN